MIADQKKTKAQLISELESMRHRLAVLGQQPSSNTLRAEKTLRESQEHLSWIADHSPVMLFRHRHVPEFDTLEFSYVSPHSVALTGFTPEEIMADGKLLTGRYHPDDVPEWWKAQRLITEANGDWLYDIRYQRKDGQYIWVHQHSLRTYLPDGSIEGSAYWVDVTAKKTAEQALRDSEERYRNLVEGSLQGIMVHREHKPLFANQAYAAMHGYESPEEIIALGDTLALRAPHQRARIIEYGKARMRGEYAPASYELEDVRKDGSTFWTNSLHTVIDWDGQPAIQATFFDINDRKLAEQSVRESEARYRSLVEQAPDAFFVWDLDGRFLDVNDKACESLGYTREELLKLSVSDIEMKFDADTLRERRARLVPGQPSTTEGLHRRNDGTTFPVEVRSGVVEVGEHRIVQSLVRDITERKQAEQDLRRSEERYRNLAEGSIQGLYVQRDFQLLYANEALAHLLGYPSVDAILAIHNPLHWVAPEDLERMTEYGQARNAGKPAPEHFELQVKRADGSIIWVENISKRIMWEGASATQVVYVDITEQKRVQELQEGFISIVSHELKTPLTALIGAVSLLRGITFADNGSDGREIMDIVSLQATRLIRLVDDVTDTQQIDTGTLSMQPEPTEVAQLLTSAVECNWTFARAHGVTLVKVSCDCSVMVDPHRCLQVLTNLISNSAKYTHRGDAVTVQAVRNGDLVRISVTDHGPGIPEDFRSRIFGRFERADVAASGTMGGTGLGLSIAKALVEQMGGTIGFESEPGRATTFFVDLPVWHGASNTL